MNFKICSLLILSAFTFNCINGSNRLRYLIEAPRIDIAFKIISEVESARLLVTDNLERIKRNPDSKELQACLEKSQAHLARVELRHRSNTGLAANTPG